MNTPRRRLRWHIFETVFAVALLPLTLPAVIMVRGGAR